MYAKDYDTPRGECCYIIKKKIDTSKDLKSIIEENIKNFKNPLTEQEFVENQILLDYIISEKYKNSDKIYDTIYRKINKEHPEMKKLLGFCKNNKINIYFDKSIDADLYSHLKKYYFNQNTLNKKLRIKLEINEKILSNPKKIESIIEKIVIKLSKITKIPIKELYVTNIRKNCLIFDIFRLGINWIRNIINNISSNNYGFPDEVLSQHRDEFINFLKEIENENIRVVDTNEHANANPNVNDDYRAQIQGIIQNFVINPNTLEAYEPEVIFDFRYDKEKGEFGRIFSIFNFINKYKKSKIKNGKIYYYPNENCEGYGLRINRNDDIFSPDGNYWCTVYTNLKKNEWSYKMDGISGDIIEKRYPDGTRKQFKIFFQCKIRQTSLRENQNGIIEEFNGNPDDDIIPYRIIKEHLGVSNRWQFNF